MHRATVAAVLVALGLLTACTSGGGGARATSTPPSPAPTASPTPASPTAEPPSVTSSTPPSSEPRPTATPTVPGNPCTTANLTVAAQPGSGASGTQYETITLTNKGSSTCTTIGFPGISLRLSGQALGQPASRSVTPGTAVTLAPGATATSAVTSASTCDAPLSDVVRVYPPNDTGFVDVPAQLRGCPLTVAALTTS